MTTSRAGVDFGQRLRECRRTKGLSQVELGGDRFSGSYISHLESGRRAATPEIVTFLARRLGVTADELGFAEPATRSEASAIGTLESLLVAERAWHDRDFGVAASFAEKAAEVARGRGLPERHWEALYVQAQALFSGGRFAEAARITLALADHDVAHRSRTLRAQALALASAAHRASDQIGPAIALAGQAVEVAAEAPQVVLAESLMALVGALLEAGRPNAESDRHCARLAAVADSVESAHARGLISWTLGTVAFRQGALERGMEMHERARGLMSPNRDVKMWLRLHKTMANCRLDAGILDGVAECLDVARAGLQLFGNPSDLAELRIAEAKFARVAGEPGVAIELLREHLGDPDFESSYRGAVAALLGTCLARRVLSTRRRRPSARRRRCSTLTVCTNRHRRPGSGRPSSPQAPGWSSPTSETWTPRT